MLLWFCCPAREIKCNENFKLDINVMVCKLPERGKRNSAYHDKVFYSLAPLTCTGLFLEHRYILCSCEHSLVHWNERWLVSASHHLNEIVFYFQACTLKVYHVAYGNILLWSAAPLPDFPFCKFTSYCNSNILIYVFIFQWCFLWLFALY